MPLALADDCLCEPATAVEALAPHPASLPGCVLGSPQLIMLGALTRSAALIHPAHSAVRRWTQDSMAAYTACPGRLSSGQPASSMGPGGVASIGRRLSLGTCTVLALLKRQAICVGGLRPVSGKVENCQAFVLEHPRRSLPRGVEDHKRADESDLLG
jgi:hypothetical protein